MHFCHRCHDRDDHDDHDDEINAIWMYDAQMKALNALNVATSMNM